MLVIGPQWGDAYLWVLRMALLEGSSRVSG